MLPGALGSSERIQCLSSLQFYRVPSKHPDTDAWRRMVMGTTATHAPATAPRLNDNLQRIMAEAIFSQLRVTQD